MMNYVLHNKFKNKEAQLFLVASEWDLLQLVELNTTQVGVSATARAGPLNVTSFRLKEQYSQGLVNAATTAKVNQISRYEKNTVGRLKIPPSLVLI